MILIFTGGNRKIIFSKFLYDISKKCPKSEKNYLHTLLVNYKYRTYMEAPLRVTKISDLHTLIVNCKSRTYMEAPLRTVKKS